MSTDSCSFSSSVRLFVAKGLKATSPAAAKDLAALDVKIALFITGRQGAEGTKEFNSTFYRSCKIVVVASLDVKPAACLAPCSCEMSATAFISQQPVQASSRFVEIVSRRGRACALDSAQSTERAFRQARLLHRVVVVPWTYAIDWALQRPIHGASSD